MTIDEAIEQVEERACGNDQCAKDHAQLADWLRELRRARMEIDLLKTLRDGFKADAQKYKGENARLRELVRDMFEEIEADGFNPMVERHGNSTVYYVEDPSWRVGIRERVRKLGVEVDG